MMENIILTAVLITAFLMCVCAYSLGVKHGRTVKADGVPNVNPIKAYKAVKADIEQQKQVDMFAQGLQNILSFGEPTETKEGR